MDWLEHWKQVNPLDQFMAILASVDGNVHNLKHGIGGNKPITRLEQHVEELRALEPYLRRGSWGEQDGQTCLHQSCEGEVVSVSDDCVVVVLIANGELVEQTYDISQFIDGQIPKKGDILEVKVQFAKLQSKTTIPDQTRIPRKNVVPLPRIF